jgi:hypothetical protein
MNPPISTSPTLKTVNFGTDVSMRGSVVEVRFKTNLPPINTLLRAGKEGGAL